MLESRLNTLAKSITPGMVSLSAADAILLHRAASSRAMPGATFLEFAAGWGFSTLCILDAIQVEKARRPWQEVRFITTEVDGECWRVLDKLLEGQPVEFRKGDAREMEWNGLALDFLFIDSDHTAPIMDWYASTLFPLVKPGGLVAVHDVLDPTSEPYCYELGQVKKAAIQHGFKRIELLDEEELSELQLHPLWPHSHFGVRRGLNTLVMERNG